MNLEELRKNHKADILRIAEKYGVTNIRVFGSVARGDSKEGSDVDLLAKFPPKTSFIEYGKFLNDLEQSLPFEFDFLSENGINKYIKEEVINSSITL
ncbi:MAG TPA: nucleotidyltransferase [Alphaproteobacteria bacterium]|nr:nucleotidyltransferase [Alphaproteobacteria bacterium]